MSVFIIIIEYYMKRVKKLQNVHAKVIDCRAPDRLKRVRFPVIGRRALRRRTLLGGYNKTTRHYKNRLKFSRRAWGCVKNVASLSPPRWDGTERGRMRFVRAPEDGQEVLSDRGEDRHAALK